MNLRDTISKESFQFRVLADGLDESEGIFIGSKSETVVDDATVGYVKQIRFYEEGNNASLVLATGVASTGSAPQPQIETLTIVAASGATSSGNLVITVTGAGMTGSPFTVVAPLLSGSHTTAALVATVVRNALAASSRISSLYTVGGTGTAITLTRKANAANDATLQLVVTAGFGVSAATSANTQLGVLGTEFTNQDNKDARGVILPTSTICRYGKISVSGEGSVWMGMEIPGSPPADFGNVLLVPGQSLKVTYPFTLSFECNEPGSIVDIVYIGK